MKQALGGFVAGGMITSKDGYDITIANKDGGLSSNISFVADGNNGTTTHCIDPTVGLDNTLNCSLLIGRFCYITFSM